MLFFLSHWFQVPSKHVSVLSLMIMINVVGGRDVTKNIPKIFLRKKRNLNPTLNFISEEKLCSVGGRKWNAFCPAEALIDRDLQGLRGLAISVDFRPDEERLLEKKKSRIWVVSADYPWPSEISGWIWNTLSLWLNRVTQENNCSNEGRRHLLTNVLDTEDQLKLLALQGEENWQSFAEAGQKRSLLNDAMEEKEACSELCICHVPLSGGME